MLHAMEDGAKASLCGAIDACSERLDVDIQKSKYDWRLKAIKYGVCKRCIASILKRGWELPVDIREVNMLHERLERDGHLYDFIEDWAAQER
jgi:hypothetical protein